MTLMAFVFSSNAPDLRTKIFLINCPYPIEHGLAYNVQILGNNGLPDPRGTVIQFLVNYTQTTSPSNSTQGSFFNCYTDIVTGNHAITVVVKSYGMVQFGVPMGGITYFADTAGVFFGKATLAIQIIYSAITAPSQVTGMAWYAYVNLILVIFVAIGVVMVIRGT